MNSLIHPAYHQTTIHCSNCDTDYAVGSTREGLRVDVCSNCHPFYTGGEQRASQGGRIARFEQRRARAAATTS
jgi:large subunit ribosomal protein L31